MKSLFNVDARAPSIPLLNFPFKREYEAFDHLKEKKNHGKGDILGPKYGQDCILLMSFSTRIKTHKKWLRQLDN